MSTDILIDRNARHAGTLRAASRSLTPALRTIVLTCADHRVDPAHVLDLQPGEAIVLRNAGGRVTPDVVRSLLVLASVAAVEGIDAAFEIVVMHHTDCGLSRLDSPEHAPLLADYAGVDENDVAKLTVADPWRSVNYDRDRLRELVQSSQTTVTGLVYDLESGTVRRS
jgi:carbonic anhydrase